MKSALYFIAIVFIFAKGFAQESLRQRSVVESINRFQQQTFPSHFYGQCNENQSHQSECSNLLYKLVEDDDKDRSLSIIKSNSKSCRDSFENSKVKNSHVLQNMNNPELLQSVFENQRYSYLGDYTHQRIKSCLRKPTFANKAVAVTKFYHYAARLNETAKTIAIQKSEIDRLLGKKLTDCPDQFYLNQANEACRLERSCAKTQDFQQLVKNVEADKKILNQISAELKKMPKNCNNDVQCVNAKKAHNTIVAGLIKKNPWFLSEKFNNNSLNGKMESSLKIYFQEASDNLSTQQNDISHAAACLHANDTKNCDIDKMRVALSLTEPMPMQISVSNTSDYNIDLYNSLNQCLENAAYDRNVTSDTINHAFLSATLGLIALPLGVAVRGVQIVGQVSKLAVARLGMLVGAEAAVSIAAGSDSFVQAYDVCFNKSKINFKFKKIESENICNQSSNTLSHTNIEESSCLINMGLASLNLIAPTIGTTQLVSAAKSAGYAGQARAIPALPELNSSLSVTPTATRSTTTASITAEAPGATQLNQSRRASDLTGSNLERRVAPSVKNTKIVAGIEGKSVREISELPSIPNIPKNIKIYDVEKLDGRKALVYTVYEKLPNGKTVLTPKEFYLDEVSGAINATNPAGKELLQAIASEKAGKAYYAFFDVGSLGAVNKTFKAGVEAGDRYIKGIAQKVLQHGEGKVTLARVGGDEFALIIDETDPKKVKAIIEKIQSEIRKDLSGDLHLVFKEEKIIQAQAYKDALAKLEKENPNGVTEEQRRALRKGIDELARVQQPDVSIGIAQIGSKDTISDLAIKAEEQAKRMKIQTALQFGRSAEKYGVKSLPRSRPNPLYKAPIEDPIPSTTWQSAQTVSRGTTSTTASNMNFTRKEEFMRVGENLVVRYEDELGRSVYRTEHYITDIAGKRVPVLSDIPTKGSTGLLDGVHPEGQRLIQSHSNTPDATFVMLKLKSLKYINYFKNGTQDGDEMLAIFSETLKTNLRSTDLSFKLNGADFLVGAKNLPASQLAARFGKIEEQLKNNPRVIEILNRQTSSLTEALKEAKRLGKSADIVEIEKNIKSIENFNFNVQFQSVQKTELGAGSSFKDIYKKLDDKFAKD